MSLGIMGIIGIILAASGLLGIGCSIARLLAIRRSGLADQEARDAMLVLLPKNMLALLAAVVGLMLMVIDLVI